MQRSANRPLARIVAAYGDPVSQWRRTNSRPRSASDECPGIGVAAMSRPFNKSAPGHRASSVARLMGDTVSQPCVYFMGWKDGPVKIGYARNLERRWQEIQIACPYPIFVWAILVGRENDERLYHVRFREHRIRGEWFDRCDAIEAEIARLSAGGKSRHLVSVSGTGTNRKNANAED